MKKIRLITMMLSLIFLNPFCPASFSQNKTKKELERELEILKEIDKQKKALVEEKKRALEEDMPEIMIIHKKTLENLDNSFKDAEIQEEVASRIEDALRDHNFEKNRSIFLSPGGFDSGNGSDFFNGHPFFGDFERTTWDFSKSLRENSFSRDYTFEVEPNAGMVIMSVTGDCKEGEIHIKILMPGGKTYSDIVLDESGNLNWKKSFRISDGENKNKYGAWKFQIDATKATGYFKISLQTF